MFHKTEVCDGLAHKEKVVLHHMYVKKQLYSSISQKFMGSLWEHIYK